MCIYIYTYMYMYIYVDVDINIDIYTIYIHYITLHCITCTFTFHLHLHFPLQYYSTVHILHTYITYAYTYLCTYITITITTTIAITIPFHSIQYKTPPYNTIPYYTIQYMHNQSVSSQKKVHHNSSQSPTKDRDSTAGHTAFLGHRPACVQPTHPCVLVPPAMTGHRHKVVMTWMIWGVPPWGSLHITPEVGTITPIIPHLLRNMFTLTCGWSLNATPPLKSAPSFQMPRSTALAVLFGTQLASPMVNAMPRVQNRGRWAGVGQSDPSNVGSGCKSIFRQYDLDYWTIDSWNGFRLMFPILSWGWGCPFMVQWHNHFGTTARWNITTVDCPCPGVFGNPWVLTHNHVVSSTNSANISRLLSKPNAFSASWRQ